MIAILLIILVIALLFMSSKREMFGYDESKRRIILDDPLLDMSEYAENPNMPMNHDLIEKLVLATNKYVSEKTGVCTYVIETLSIKKYVHNVNNKQLYRCMFMLMKQHGFAFGFSVSVDIDVNLDGTAQVLSARSQPMNVNPPTTLTPFDSDIEGHEFLDYDKIRDSELKLIKNK